MKKDHKRLQDKINPREDSHSAINKKEAEETLNIGSTKSQLLTKVFIQIKKLGKAIVTESSGSAQTKRPPSQHHRYFR